MRYISLLILSCLICPSFGQNINTGTPFTSMANSCIMLKSPFEVYHNQAGLSDINNFNFGFTYTDRFHKEEFSSKSLFIVIPLFKLVSAIDYSYYGFSGYYREGAGLSVSKKLSERLSIGTKFKYLHSFVSRYSRHFTEYNFDVGLQYLLADDLRLGAHIANPITKFNYISTSIFRSGVSWQCLKSVLITGEYVYKRCMRNYFRFGFSWEAYRNLVLSIGRTSIDMSMYTGLSYKYKNICSSLSICTNDRLGTSSALSVDYEF